MKIKTTVTNLASILTATKQFEPAQELHAYQKKYLTINEDKVPRELFLYPKESVSLRLVNSYFENVFTGMHKLTKYILFEDESLLNYVGRRNFNIPGLLMRDPATLITYARIDTVYSDYLYKVLEFNCRRPQMYEDADWFSRYIQERVGGSMDVTLENNSHEIAHAVQDHFLLNSQKTKPDCIVLVSNQIKEETSFSFYNTLQKMFRDTEICVINTTQLGRFYEDILLVNDSITYREKQVDLIIVQNVGGRHSFFQSGSIRNSKIAHAYNNGTIEIISSPATMIAGTKLLLDLIHDPELQTKIKLTNNEIEALNIMPQSVHSQKLHEWDLVDKDTHVIKKTGVSGGKGVILGSAVTQKEWEGELNKLITHNRSFILQKRIFFQEDKILDFEGNFHNAYVTLEPVLVSSNGKPKISGYATRAIKVDDYELSMKFNPAYNQKNILYGALVETI